MLCVNRYPQTHVDECRQRIAAQVASYRAFVRAAGNGQPADAALDAARVRFEADYFANLVVVLDACFMHRSRTLELKDGNPMNEVRMLSAAVTQHGGVLTADKTIKYVPAKAVLKLAIGDRVAMDAAGFATLSKAFFAALEATFV